MNEGDEALSFAPRKPEQDWSSVILAPLLVIVALGSIPVSVQAGDAGEFATIMLDGGVPHPSGYPWMRALGLLAQLFWAMGVPAATAAALPPALCGVGAWLLVHRCTATLGYRWIGAFVVLLAAASPLAVTHINDSEVWGPHLLLSNMFLFAALHRRPRPLLLGLLLGLAVSHHLTAILLVPVAIAAALPLREGDANEQWLRKLLRNGALGFTGSALGLLPYASLPIGSGGTWRWGDVQTFDGLVHHVLRRDYGTFSLSLHEEEVAASDTLARAFSSLAEVFSAGTSHASVFGVVLVLACLTLAAVWVRGHSEHTRPALAVGWCTAVIASTCIFPALQNIDPGSAFGAWILERFDLLSVALLVVPLTLSLAWIGAWLRPRLLTRPWILPVGTGVLATALVLAQLLSVLEQGRPYEARGVERAALDLVASPDPHGPAIPSAGPTPVRAIVFGTDDHRSFPVTYVQAVRGAGAHTLYIDASLLSHAWYRAQLRARVPSLPDVDKPMRMMGAIWMSPELGEVPIYIANVWGRPPAVHPRVPEGMLWRAVPPPQVPGYHPEDWTPDKVLERHLAACARMGAQAQDFRAAPRDPWSSDLKFSYREKAQALAGGFARAGDTEAVATIAAALRRLTGDAL